MTDYATFHAGGSDFPLTTPSSNTLLRDVDPAIFYALEYFKSVIETHIGARLLAEAGTAGVSAIEEAVAETIPLNPESYLTERHTRFPLLAIYRKSSTFRYLGQRKLSVNDLEVAYVLPPLEAGQAERLLPILKGIALVIDNRAEQGHDPAYTPSTPTGTADEPVWKADRAGLARCEVTGVTYGGYTPTQDLFFPAVLIAFQMQERSDPKTEDMGLFDGADIDIKLEPTTGEDPIDDFIDVETRDFPRLDSLDVSSGFTAGGDAVTVTGAGFDLGTAPMVLFGGANASSIIVVSPTQITCLTPAHAAGAVDVQVVNADDNASNILSASFTYS